MAGNTIPLVRGAATGASCRLSVCLNPDPRAVRGTANDRWRQQMLNRDYARGLSVNDFEGRRTWIDEKVARFHLFR